MLSWDELDKYTDGPLAQYQIIRRNGAVVPFEPKKIADAMMRVFLAVHGKNGLHALRQRPVLACSNVYSTNKIERLLNLLGMGRVIKLHLLTLFTAKDWSTKLFAAKVNGFFSASEANLRNAP